MKKIIILFFIMALISGCTGNGGATTRYEPFTGTNGMVIDFARDSPPEEVYENQRFNVLVDAKNDGASDIIDGKIMLGFEKDVIETDKSEEDVELTGRSVNNDIGEEKFINFNLRSKNLDPQVEVIESLITATACYRYQTIFGKAVCVDTDPLDNRLPEYACQAEDISSSGQGAPIAITKVEVEMVPHNVEGKIKPMFKIYIENKGGGIVYNPDIVERACSSDKLERDDINTLYVAEAKLSNDYYLECSPRKIGEGSGYVKLREDEKIIRCAYEEGIDANIPSFTAPLVIKLEYGYSETISETLLIRKEV
ncbi:MAG: hypothetical protein ABII01_04520 [Candidatus Woesearchaeota archaeon]